MKDRHLSIFFTIFISLVLWFCWQPALAQNSRDSDGDGYADEEEIKNGYSPFNALPVKLKDSDADQDGLSDHWELVFGTDLQTPDSDGDGYSDYEEVERAYDPLAGGGQRLAMKIEIDLKTQYLHYYLAGHAYKSWPVSSGRAGYSTPTGEFKIVNKALKPWSKAYGLWMPYWLGLGGAKLRSGSIGIHELPVWPGGYREGADHLGKPASHGCVRLGVGPAAYLYERAEVGTPVIIK